MAWGRRPFICHFCRQRPSVTTRARRRLDSTASRQLETVTQPEDRKILLHEPKSAKRSHRKGPPDQVPVKIRPIEADPRYTFQEPGDGFAEHLGALEELSRTSDERVKKLRSLSNPLPEPLTGRMSLPSPVQATPSNKLPETPMPHSTFRRQLREASGDEKQTKLLLRTQLRGCAWPKDIFRVIAVALQTPPIPRDTISLNFEPIYRALFRCRDNVSDLVVLGAINTIVARFEAAGMEFDPRLLHMGLKFAARARQLASMKKYLRAMREKQNGMTNSLFRTVIAKFSIGARGLGELRNGRWRRQDLLQVLHGSDEMKALPKEEQYHLGSFVVRENWRYLVGWIAVLARCRDSDSIWQEWVRWKVSPDRANPKPARKNEEETTTSSRTDYWFLGQMAISGDYARAWQILREIGRPFSDCDSGVRLKLLDVDALPFISIWDDSVRDEMVRKYDAELCAIERAMGIEWVPVEGAGGLHFPLVSQEMVFETLSAQDSSVENDTGYPYDEPAGPRSANEAQSEARKLLGHDLHDQKDTALANDSSFACSEGE